MKTISKIVSATAIAAIIFVSCKKDDPTPAPLTTQQQVQGIWTFEKSIDHSFNSGISVRDTTIGVPGEYLDFRADNKVYSYIDTDYDTASYSILNNNKVILNYNFGYQDTLDIQALTSNRFQLYGKETFGADYYEFTLFLKK